MLEIMELLGNKAVLALIFISAIAIFLVLREVFCWYYKINKIVDVLERNEKVQKETNRLLEELNKHLQKNKQLYSLIIVNLQNCGLLEF